MLFFSAEKQFPLDQQESATDLRLDYNKFNYHFLFIWLVYGRARYHCREIGQLKGETFNGAGAGFWGFVDERRLPATK